VSIAKAQIEALRAGLIQSIGDTGFNKVKPGDLPILEQTLALYGQAFNTAIGANLQKTGSISSGKLAEPEMPIITKFGTGYVLSVGYEKGSEQDKYFRFVDKGVQGVGGKNAKPKKNTGEYSYKTPYPNKKMATNILLWLRKSANSSRNENVSITKAQRKRKKLSNIVSKTDSLKILAYKISSAIKRDGLRATFFFDKAIKEVFNKDFIADIALAIGGDVQIQIKQTINESKNGNNSNK
jgi:hypothetical protein